MLPLIVKEKKKPSPKVPLATILLLTSMSHCYSLHHDRKRLGVVIRLLTWDSSEKPGYASDTLRSHG